MFGISFVCGWLVDCKVVLFSFKLFDFIFSCFKDFWRNGFDVMWYFVLGVDWDDGYWEC